MTTTSDDGNQPVADSADTRAPRTVTAPTRDPHSSSSVIPPDLRHQIEKLELWLFENAPVGKDGIIRKLLTHWVLLTQQIAQQDEQIANLQTSLALHMRADKVTLDPQYYEAILATVGCTDEDDLFERIEELAADLTLLRSKIGQQGEGK